MSPRRIWMARQFLPTFDWIQLRFPIARTTTLIPEWAVLYKYRDNAFKQEEGTSNPSSNAFLVSISASAKVLHRAPFGPCFRRFYPSLLLQLPSVLLSMELLSTWAMTIACPKIMGLKVIAVTTSGLTVFPLPLFHHLRTAPGGPLSGLNKKNVRQGYIREIKNGLNMFVENPRRAPWLIRVGHWLPFRYASLFTFIDACSLEVICRFGLLFIPKVFIGPAGDDLFLFNPIGRIMFLC